MDKAFSELTVEETLALLQTDRHQGLGEAEAGKRLRVAGPNRLKTVNQDSRLKLLAAQFRDPLVSILLLAACLAFYLDDRHTGIILTGIVGINALIGFYQEYNVARILEALQKYTQATATVIRDGRRRELDRTRLVPGDLVCLEEGAAVPADLRLIQAAFLSTNDFILTGESLPQPKRAEGVYPGAAPLSEQDNLIFMGTTIAQGNGLAVVIMTGMNTAVGHLAKTSAAIARNPSTLEREIDHLARIILKIAGWIALILFAANVGLTLPEATLSAVLTAAKRLDAAAFGSAFQTDDLFRQTLHGSLLFAVGVAAACVPQGLPTQITIALSLGVERLARRNAVVKKLSAVETLGSTTVICTDKTGTLTRNAMTVTRFYNAVQEFTVLGSGYEPAGDILKDGAPLTSMERRELWPVLAIGVLASRGRALPPDGAHDAWHASGDPTEAAFTPLALKAGLDLEQLERALPTARELPFDDKRKRMTVYRGRDGVVTGYMKGALGSVLACCGHIDRNGEVAALTDGDKRELETIADRYGRMALRVIALAYRKLAADEKESAVEENFVFAGLAGMIDPPRNGVREAVAACRRAQIRLIMITGDNPLTATAIAEAIGLNESRDASLRVLEGGDIKALSDQELKTVLMARSLIFSRVSAGDKLRIVSLLKEMGEVVAVTGDGVNDTLSLKKADIGVAMGKTGSDVAKEAAEIILLDDDFGTLSLAIREGRTIFANLVKTILGNVTAILGELCLVVLGFMMFARGLPQPITAAQILAVDLVGEILPLAALTLDPGQASLMAEPPRKPGEHVLNPRTLANAAFFGLVIGALSYWAFHRVLVTGGGLASAQSATYLTIILVQLANLLGLRTRQPLLSAYTFTNRLLWGSIGLSLVLVALLIYTPFGQAWFGFGALAFSQLQWPALGIAVMLVLHEIRIRFLAGRNL